MNFKWRIILKMLTVLLVLLCNSGVSFGKVYTRCGLTQELLNKGFPRSFIGHWVCLVESESGKNTSKITDRAKGKGLGLFQVNSKEWCNFGRAGGKCNMKCEDLVNEDISDDSACAKKIHGQVGFQGWQGWVRSCKGRPLPIPTC